MKQIATNKSAIKKTVFLLLGAFLLLFLFRFGYELFFSGNDIIVEYSSGSSFSAVDSEEKSYRNVSGNVASEKILTKDSATGGNITLDQKYEKTANVSANTRSFEPDLLKLSTAIEANEAMIQMEDLRGLSGFQRMSMTIGVTPENFDSLVAAIKAIGHLESFQVTKTDQTDLFRDLMAEQQTLQTTKASYLAIKEKGGTIQDLLLLEEKVLGIEEQLKGLGVDLGIFSSENSFCTIKFTLRETASSQISVRFIFSCIKDSFFWSLGVFALLCFVVLAFVVFAAIMVALVRYMQKAQSAPVVPPVGSLPLGGVAPAPPVGDLAAPEPTFFPEEPYE